MASNEGCQWRIFYFFSEFETLPIFWIIFWHRIGLYYTCFHYKLTIRWSSSQLSRRDWNIWKTKVEFRISQIENLFILGLTSNQVWFSGLGNLWKGRLSVPPPPSNIKTISATVKHQIKAFRNPDISYTCTLDDLSLTVTRLLKYVVLASFCTVSKHYNHWKWFKMILSTKIIVINRLIYFCLKNILHLLRS